MPASTILNKMKKDELVAFCESKNVAVPATAKTKQAIIDFMVAYDKWEPNLDQLLESAAPAAAPAKAKAGKVDDTAKQFEQKFQEIQKQIDELKARPISAGASSSVPAPAPKTESLDPIKKEIEKLQSQLNAIKKDVEEIKNRPAPKAQEKSGETGKSQREIDIEILENIPEEFTYLDDVYGTLDDIDDMVFEKTVRYFLATKVIQGQEGEGEFQIETSDGLKIGMIKK